MTAPRDGDRVRVVVEGTFHADVADEHVTLDGGQHVWLSSDALAALLVVTIAEAGYPGSAGTFWVDGDGSPWFTLVSGHVISKAGIPWSAMDAAAKFGPMRRLRVGDPS